MKEPKHLVLTGGTSGLGRATVDYLAGNGWKITILARNKEKVIPIQQQYGDRIGYVSCDLEDLDSVRQAAVQLQADNRAIDVLLNNAGGMFSDYKESKDGVEYTFAVNYLSHFLLTTLLTEKLVAEKARIINVSSALHQYARLGAEFQLDKENYSAVRAYNNSKLYNILFTRALHKKLEGTGATTYSLHPGVVRTGFAQGSHDFFGILTTLFRPFYQTPEKGARTQIFLATATGIENYSGAYFKNKKPQRPSNLAMDDNLAQRLWDYSHLLITRLMKRT